MQDPDEEIAKIDRTVRSQCGSQVGTFSDWVEVEAPLVWGQIESHTCLPPAEGFFSHCGHSSYNRALCLSVGTDLCQSWDSRKDCVPD